MRDARRLLSHADWCGQCVASKDWDPWLDLSKAAIGTLLSTAASITTGQSRGSGAYGRTTSETCLSTGGARDPILNGRFDVTRLGGSDPEPPLSNATRKLPLICCPLLLEIPVSAYWQSNLCCKPLPGGISVQNIPHGPVYLVGLAGYSGIRKLRRYTARPEQLYWSPTETERHL